MYLAFTYILQTTVHEENWLKISNNWKFCLRSNKKQARSPPYQVHKLRDVSIWSSFFKKNILTFYRHLVDPVHVRARRQQLGRRPAAPRLAGQH